MVFVAFKASLGARMLPCLASRPRAAANIERGRSRREAGASSSDFGWRLAAFGCVYEGGGQA